MTVHALQTRADRLWLSWVDANKRAQESYCFEDAREAARIWREFLEEWLPPADFVKICEERDRRRAAAK